MRSRSDGNQKEIVKFLRSIGVHVKVLSSKGVGFDILCRIPGRVFIMEIKPPDQLGVRGKILAPTWKFTPDEEKMREAYDSDYHIVKTCEEAKAVVARYRFFQSRLTSSP